MEIGVGRPSRICELYRERELRSFSVRQVSVLHGALPNPVCYSGSRGGSVIGKQNVVPTIRTDLRCKARTCRK